MKSKLWMGVTALALGLAVLSNAYAGESTMSLGEKMEAYKEGKYGVYGKTPISDVGSIVYHNTTRPWDGKTQDDPSHYQHTAVSGRYTDAAVVGGETKSAENLAYPNTRTWDGKTQDDPSHFRNTDNAIPQSGMMNCADMPCCKNMKMDKQKCETMVMSGMSKGKGAMVKCADMPCCKNMKMDMHGCEKMMSK
ncbi:MAG: hypothetical protein EBQ92_00960 [Proteobacteria bacterium]|nr:hypothetical protein [Pseudomonadota bacterium]